MANWIGYIMPAPIKLSKSGGLGVISQGYLDCMTYLCKVKGYSLFIESSPEHDFGGGDPSDVYAVLVDLSNKRSKKLVSHLWLTHVKSGYYTVDMVQVSKHYGGQGISYSMYKALLKNTTIKLVCGDIQSPGGRYIWRKLIKSKAVVVKAGEIKNYARKYDVKILKDNVYAVIKDELIDIYSDGFEAFRLFAHSL